MAPRKAKKKDPTHYVIYVIIPLHQAFFCFLPPRITEQAMQNSNQIGDWYIE